MSRLDLLEVLLYALHQTEKACVIEKYSPCWECFFIFRNKRLVEQMEQPEQVPMVIIGAKS